MKELGYRNMRYIPMEAITNSVESYLGIKIELRKSHFSKFIGDLPSRQVKSGVMSKVSGNKSTIRKAVIISNLDFSPVLRRFFIVHELGHLVLKSYSSEYFDLSGKTLTNSLYVSPDINYIKDKYLDDKFVLAEQEANIFALMVMMLENLSISDVGERGIQNVCIDYGVTEMMVVSRVILSEYISSLLQESCSRTLNRRVKKRKRLKELLK